MNVTERRKIEEQLLSLESTKEMLLAGIHRVTKLIDSIPQISKRAEKTLSIIIELREEMLSEHARSDLLITTIKQWLADESTQLETDSNILDEVRATPPGVQQHHGLAEAGKEVS